MIPFGKFPTGFVPRWFVAIFWLSQKSYSRLFEFRSCIDYRLGQNYGQIVTLLSPATQTKRIAHRGRAFSPDLQIWRLSLTDPIRREIGFYRCSGLRTTKPETDLGVLDCVRRHNKIQNKLTFTLTCREIEAIFKKHTTAGAHRRKNYCGGLFLLWIIASRDRLWGSLPC